MSKKFKSWCYGGKSKSFFIEQSEAIHQYNSKMMDSLLFIMTIILGCYVAIEVYADPVVHYFIAYLVCFALLLIMYCTFKYKINKSMLFTRIYILLFAIVMFVFVCVLGTVFEPEARAIMFIVYLLVMPMFFVSPMHYTYSFLTLATCIFSTMSLWIKDIEYARMDVSHGITCLIIGLFVSHHILESRMALYALNEQLDVRNIQLDKEIQEKEIQLLQSRISIMLTQIQPHFLYNALTAICGLCDSNPKEAKKVTAQFSDYLRHNLESLNHSEPIPFEKELRHTQAYLEIEKKRFGEKLNIVCDIQVVDFYLPALTIQPIVENAVKHGVMKQKGGGTVTISTREQESCYEILIADDGIGFHPNEPQVEPHAHIGTSNVRSRLGSLCGGSLIIVSQVNVGTIATIRIPKDEKQTGTH